MAFGHQKSIKGAHVVLIYNGPTHFTGTGYFIINGDGVHLTFYFALHSIIKSNPLKPF